MSHPKTNAVRMLDRERIDYELRAYPVDESDLSAERAAEKLGMPPECVFKTLITHAEPAGYLFALLPAGTELDLRGLAAASGNKRVELVPLRDVLGLTGYMRGAVTPLAAKKSYPVYIDESVELWPLVGLSGGVRGLEIILAPADLIRVTQARLADLVRRGGVTG
jgi:Cys-tRNA(Pro)/Cys-tRNA(Cys) deacylase